jgi:hypothetical protein
LLKSQVKITATVTVADSTDQSQEITSLLDFCLLSSPLLVFPLSLLRSLYMILLVS